MPYVEYEKKQDWKKYEQNKQQKNRPIAELKDGNLRITIWNNKGMKVIEVYRIYKDKNGKWQRISKFNKRDLLKLSLLLQQAYILLK